jgi:DNA-binding CsgD family transcriptional regulator
MPQPEPDVEVLILGALRTYADRNRRFKFLLSDLQDIAALCHSVLPKPPVPEFEPRRSSRSMAVKAPARPVAAPETPSGSTDPSTPLSARERAIQRRRADPTACAVLALVAKGHTNRVICEQLSLTINQVKKHLTSWSKASEVSGRAALATWARRSGIIAGTEVTR